MYCGYAESEKDVGQLLAPLECFGSDVGNAITNSDTGEIIAGVKGTFTYICTVLGMLRQGDTQKRIIFNAYDAIRNY